MKRGMIELSTEELLLLKSIVQTSANTPPELMVRTTAVTEQDLTNLRSIALELTIESVEWVLDSLPIPSKNEKQIVATVRKKFVAFLAKLRANVQVNSQK